MFLNKKIKYLILVLAVIGLALPFYASAFLDGPIVPCGTRASGVDCTLCHIFEMGRNIIQFIWELILVIAPVFVLVGGVFILTAGARPEQVGLGKKIILNAIIGVVIALLSWTILNMIFNTLVGEEGFPWPWNKPQCKGGEVITPEPPTTEGEYCVCEIPRYSLKPDKLGTDTRATRLESKETCKQACVVGNAGNYCPNSSLTILSSEDYNLYCVDESTIKSKQVCRLYLGDAAVGAGCRLGTTCYDSDDACMNDAMSTYKNKCYLDNNGLCEGYYKGFSTYCPTGADKGLCGDTSSKYALYEWREEKYYNPPDKPIGSYNAYECSQGAYASTNYYCRLNCQVGQYDSCYKEEVNWCDQVKDSFSCFGGKFTCKNMTTSQEGDACYALKQFLNCMGNKMIYAPAAAKVISSISDNSKYKCFSTGVNTGYWDEKGKCSGATDSCTGTCCGHSKYSLHYGGKPNNIDCRQCSWAVDFAEENYYQNLKNVAEVCAEELNYGKVDVEKEESHVHIELDEVAEDLKCK